MISRIILIGSFLCILLCGTLMTVAVEKETEPVVIICYISGKAVVKTPADNKSNDLQLFDRLKAGSEIETEKNSKVIIAFFNGAEYEINEQSKVTVEQNELKSEKGSFKKTKVIPAMPKIAPIAKGENPGKRAAAVRIRSGYLEGLDLLNPYPRDGATILASNAVLSFKPVDGISKYKVEVEDEMGNSILSVETSSTAITISPNIVKDGSVYYWRVRTLNQQKRSVHAEAIFVTLSKENVKLRSTLKQQLEKQQDISLLMLLADLDRNLGLMKEACEEIQSAIKQYPDNPMLMQALSQFECPT